MPRVTLPKYFRKSEGSLVEDFQNLAGFISGPGTFAADTTNFKRGTQGAKFTTPVGTYAYRDKGSYGTFLANQKQIAMWVYIYDISTFLQIRLYLSSASSFAKYFSTTAGNVGHRMQNGWNFIILNQNEFTNTGAEVWESIAYIRYRVEPVAGTSTSVTFGGVTTNPDIIPKVVISFDDSSNTVYQKAFPMFQAAGVQGVFYVVQDLVGSTINDVTVPQLKEMYNAGWDIGNHTKTHAHLASLSDSDVKTEVQSCSNWLMQQGFSRSAWHMGIPYGDYNQHTIDLLKIYGIVSARTSDQEIGEENIPSNLLKIQPRLGLNNATTTNDIKTAIDDIVDSHFHGFFFGHVIEDAPSGSNPLSCATSVIQYLLDYCKQRQVDIVTMSEFTRQMYNPRKIVR